MMRVSAGLVVRADGCLLIAQRAPGQHHAGLWEFPGGKREKGETAEACLERELREELDLRISAPKAVWSMEAENIYFDFVRADAAGPAKCREHAAIEWVRPRALLSYPMCPADREAAVRIALNSPPVTVCVWDFDGTLADSYPVSAQLLQRALGPGRPVNPQQAISLMKHTLRECIAHYATAYGMTEEELHARFRQEEAKLPPAAFPAISGIPEAVKALSALGCRHYMLTRRDSLSLRILDAWDMAECFEDAVTAESGYPPKPDPEGLKHLIAQSGAAKDSCVMIGDRPLDIQTGEQAGILTCMLDPDGYYPDGPGTLRCERPELLPGILRPEPIPVF